MSTSIYIAIPLMAGLAMLQSATLSRFPIFGIVPQLALVVVVAWTLQQGLSEGLLWAFVAGFFIDLFTVGPIGATSLAMMAAVGTIFVMQRNFPESRVIMPIMMVLLATAVFWFVDLLFLRIFTPMQVARLGSLGVSQLDSSARAPGLLRDIAGYYSINQHTLRAIFLSAVVHGLFILPVYWAIFILERTVRPRRVEI
jgi:rod shape-determining protein MreD